MDWFHKLQRRIRIHVDMVDEYKFDITDVVPGIDWAPNRSLKAAENLIRANRVRKWLAEELGPDGWEVDFVWSPTSRILAIATITDSTLATMFKLKWMIK